MGWRYELRSKLMDGVVAAGLLLLLLMLINLMSIPIERTFFGPGLLVYILGLLSVSVIFLERSLPMRYPEWTRAWLGMTGGVLAWGVIDLSHQLGGGTMTGETGILMLILLGTVIGVLWQRVLPLGVRFFVSVVLLNWALSFMMSILQRYASSETWFHTVLQILGYIFLAGAIGAILWLLMHSQRRLQRLIYSLGVYACLTMALYLLRGWF